MDEKAKVRFIVKQVVESYLKDRQQELMDNSITVLLCYKSMNPSEILKAVTRLLEKYDATLLISKDWLPFSPHFLEKSYSIIEEMSEENLVKIVNRTSLIVFPVASYQLISKLSLTIDDDIAVWLAIQYQLEGKPVIIAKNEIEPNIYQQINAPHSVLGRIQTYIQQIQTDLVKWVPLHKMSSTIADQYHAYNDKKALILAKHIEKAHHDGLNNISFPRKNLLSPMAKDLARQLNIEIKQKF
ncbi:MAG: hypothetical protein Q8934_05785 [Bacillota bacterium]|nr:hypothetical protein [Bacillota bacterium]